MCSNRWTEHVSGHQTCQHEWLRNQSSIHYTHSFITTHHASWRIGQQLLHPCHWPASGLCSTSASSSSFPLPQFFTSIHYITVLWCIPGEDSTRHGYSNSISAINHTITDADPHFFTQTFRWLFPCKNWIVQQPTHSPHHQPHPHRCGPSPWKQSRNSSGRPSGETCTTARGKLWWLAAPKAAKAKELSWRSTKSATHNSTGWNKTHKRRRIDVFEWNVTRQ